MTFSELKFKLKRESSLGNKIFYTVPKKDFSNGNSIKQYISLPFVFCVCVSINKNGKKILNFDYGGFGGNPEDMHFFMNKDLADVYSAKIQSIKHQQLVDSLKEFEDTTNIKNRLDTYLNKHPEVFL
jgi:hypothetical protein